MTSPTSSSDAPPLDIDDTQDDDDDDDDDHASLADDVARSVLDLYEEPIALASTTTSTTRGVRVRNGSVEWTILASVCLIFPSSLPLKKDDKKEKVQEKGNRKIFPISLGLGTKTLPFGSVAKASGDLVHDCHAEVLARRGGRRWLMERLSWEMQASPSGEDREGGVVDGLEKCFERSPHGLWRLKRYIKVWWYVSTLPCGECSSGMMERRRRDEDRKKGASATSQDDLQANSGRTSQSAVIRGRNFDRERSTFMDAELAPPTLRTVPGRLDSPPSLSHSCTDKLLLWNLTGWQGCLLSRYLSEKVGIDGIVVSNPGMPGEDIQRLTEEIQRALDIRLRCFDGGRHLQAQWPSSFNTDEGKADCLSPPEVHISKLSFPQSQENVRDKATAAGLLPLETDAEPDPPQATPQLTLAPSWESISYISPSSFSSHAGSSKAHSIEFLIHGLKRGASSRRLPSTDSAATSDGVRQRAGPLKAPAGKSKLCKAAMRQLAMELEALVSPNKECSNSAGGSVDYAELKGKTDRATTMPLGLQTYRRRKALLRGRRLLRGAAEDEEEWEVVEGWLKAQRLGTCESDGEKGKDKSREGESGMRAPLQGWLVTPRTIEMGW